MFSTQLRNMKLSDWPKNISRKEVDSLIGPTQPVGIENKELGLLLNVSHSLMNSRMITSISEAQANN